MCYIFSKLLFRLKRIFLRTFERPLAVKTMLCRLFVVERKYFTCPSRESNPGRWSFRQTLYRVAVKASFYCKAVEVCDVYLSLLHIANVIRLYAIDGAMILKSRGQVCTRCGSYHIKSFIISNSSANSVKSDQI